MNPHKPLRPFADEYSAKNGRSSARRTAVLALGALVPLVLALSAIPVQAEGLSVTVSSPLPEAVVEGSVLLQGTAQDPDGDLASVQILIDGGTPALRVKLRKADSDATWEKAWNTEKVPDGRREVSVVATDKEGGTSPPMNFSLIVDNDKEPSVEATRILFDGPGDATFSLWDDLDAVPTTRLTFEVRFSEEMDEASVLDSISFAGGEAAWQLAALAPGTTFLLNVSSFEVDLAYLLMVGSSATDRAGNPLQAPYELSFRTVAEATPGTPTQGVALSAPFNPLWLGIAGAAGGIGVAGAVLWKMGQVRRLSGFLRGLPDRLRRRED
ncbi:MAG: Ig-like domain-containing protein [Thermoplasmata archaeon]